MLVRVVALTCVHPQRRAMPMLTAPEPSVKPCVHEICMAILASLRHLCRVYHLACTKSIVKYVLYNA